MQARTSASAPSRWTERRPDRSVRNDCWTCLSMVETLLINTVARTFWHFPPHHRRESEGIARTFANESARRLIRSTDCGMGR